MQTIKITADERKAHADHYEKIIRKRALLARTAWIQCGKRRVEVRIAYRNSQDDPDNMTYKVCWYEDERLKECENGIYLRQAATAMADFYLLNWTSGRRPATCFEINGMEIYPPTAKRPTWLLCEDALSKPEQMTLAELTRRLEAA